jgi:hypothetical protein
MAGRELPLAMMTMVPEPWENHESMDAEALGVRTGTFPAVTEPWDGPASMAFTDGIRIGARLDRNGLRPSRYYVTKDDVVIMAFGGGRAAGRAGTRREQGPGCSRAGCSSLTPGGGPHRSPTRSSRRNTPWRSRIVKWLDEHHVLLEGPAGAAGMDTESVRTGRFLQRQQAFGVHVRGFALHRRPDGERPACSRWVDGNGHAAGASRRKSRSCSTIISSTSSRRSRTRRLTPSARKIVTATQTMVGAARRLAESPARKLRAHPAGAADSHQRGVGKTPVVDQPAGFQSGDLADLVQGGRRRGRPETRWKTFAAAEKAIRTARTF